MELRMTPSAHRLCLWSGHMCTVFYMVGFVFLAEFLPIPSPEMPAAELAQWLKDHQIEFFVGCILMLWGAAFMAPWGSALAIWTLKTERRFPVLFTSQIVLLAASTATFIVIEIFWAVSAFRATEIDPEITQALFDAGWFLFLFIGPVFYVWVIAFGLSILLNPPEHQMFPRWVGYYSLASVLCWVMGMMGMFFKFGPTAYHGMLPTWIPLIEFFFWVEILTYYGAKALKQQEKRCQEETEEGMGTYAPSWEDPILENGCGVQPTTAAY